MPDVLASYGITLNKHGECCCPFHNEKTPSFGCFANGHAWHCFGCNEGGDIFSFVQLMEHVTFQEAVRIICQRFGIDQDARIDTVGMRQLQAKRLKAEKELEAYRAEYNNHMHKRQKYEQDLKRYAPKPGDDRMREEYLTAVNELEKEFEWQREHPWR